MANIYKPPAPLDWLSPRYKIFLAGSIEMGSAEDWQVYLEQELSELDIDIYNPRRDDWDPTWEQRASNLPFRGQVEWELGALELVNHIVMYLSPGTISPISLLELGLYARTQKLSVCCPEGFHRKGNVDIVCQRYGIRQFQSLGEIATSVKQKVQRVN